MSHTSHCQHWYTTHWRLSINCQLCAPARCVWKTIFSLHTWRPCSNREFPVSWQTML